MHVPVCVIGKQVLPDEGPHFPANQPDISNIEYNFDEVASIVTNDREPKQDKFIFEVQCA